MNLARNAALAPAGRSTVAARPSTPVCIGNFMAIGIAAKQIAVDGMRVVVAADRTTSRGADTVQRTGPARNGSTA